MKVSFEVDQNEAKLLINALIYAGSNSPNPQSAKKIKEIIQQIQADLKMEAVLAGFVFQILDPYTNAEITKDSDLRNGLGIDVNWINNFMFQPCNKILGYVLSIYKPSGQTSGITENETKKCQTVQDVIDLIQNKYEGA